MDKKVTSEDRKKLIEKITESIYAIKQYIAAEMNILSHEVRITHPQWVVLHIVNKNSNIKIKELANLLNITSSAATQIVDSLVSKGLLVRKRNPDDRRTLIIELSGKSSGQFNAIKNMRIKTLSSIFDALDNNDLLEYCRLNNKIADSIKSPGHALSGRTGKERSGR